MELKNKIYFPNLDGLRTIACLMVFSWHSLRIGHNRDSIENPWLGNFLYSFLNGQTGVSIFFVLSGFLITYLIISEIYSTGEFSLKNFYIRRVLRIWPLYFAVLLIIFVLIPFIARLTGIILDDSDAVPLNYFIFLSNFDVLRIYETGGADFLTATITWSVAIEEQFYLFWPLCFFFIRPKYFIYIFIAVIVLGLLFRITNYNQPNQLYYHSFSAVYDLAVGGLMAYCSLAYEGFRNFFKNLSTSSRLFGYAIGILFMYGSGFAKDPAILVAAKAIKPIFFAFVILDQCFNKSSFFKLSRWQAISTLGKYTYGMYMLHPLVLMVLNIIIVKVFRQSINDLSMLLFKFVLGLPLTIVAAWLSYTFLEKKFLIWKEKFNPGQIKPTEKMSVVLQKNS